MAVPITVDFNASLAARELGIVAAASVSACAKGIEEPALSR